MIEPVMPTYARTDIAFDRGEGARLYTADGRRFLDFGSGIAVNLLGHAHPKLVQVLKDQAEKLWHTSNLYKSPGQQGLAEKLVANTFADTVFFTNSGTEAMEGVFKTIRKYHSAKGNPERFRIITFEGAFHGRSLAAIAAGGQDKLLNGFGPKVDGFDQIPFGDLKALESAITDETAGVVIEPVQGEGGIRPANREFLHGIRKLCDKHGILLGLDEIQCGMGRTGKLFAYEWSDITPDVMGVAKGIGGGFPMGAFLATEDAARGMIAGTHGSTYGGNPLAMAVGNAVIDEVLADGFLERVQTASSHLKQSLAGVADRHPDVLENVRGSGLMLGLKCKAVNIDVVNALRDAGMLSVPAGDNVVRILPPLNVTDEEIAEAVDLVEQACTALTASSES